MPLVTNPLPIEQAIENRALAASTGRETRRRSGVGHLDAGMLLAATVLSCVSSAADPAGDQET